MRKNPCACDSCAKKPVPSAITPTMRTITPTSQRAPENQATPLSVEGRCSGGGCECCCNFYGAAYGRLLTNSAIAARETINDAFSRVKCSSVADVAATTQRMQIIREFTICASEIAGNAFDDDCGVSQRCCEGYAAAIEGSLYAIYIYTINNIFILSIPDEVVNANIEIAKQEMAKAIAKAKKISAMC